MKRFTFSLVLGLILTMCMGLLALPTPVAAAVTIPPGDVSGTWTAANSPYLIGGDIVVPAGQTLTIEPGVEVIWHGWYKLSVYGTLSAEGTEGAPILFGGGDPSAGWGGIRMYAGSDDSRLTHVTIEKARATGANSERLGGGLYIENASPTVSHSTIRDNFATLGGGGIALVNSNAFIADSLVIDNSASLSASANGGGIYMTNSSPTLLRNTIRGNWLNIAGSFSTPTGLGGGIYALRSSPVLRYNVIADNRVDANANSVARGGGLYFYGGNPDLVNNTIVGNWTPDQFSPTWEREGGGIYVTTAHLTIVNNLFWDNSPQQLYVDDYAVLTVAYTDVQGGEAGVAIEGNPTINNAGGNIAADPRFVDAANGDYHLEADSPAVDAGTAYFEWEGRVLVDLAPGDYLGAAPDMGAFDVAGSGQVNQPPVAVASADPDHGSAPLTVQFSADGSSDPDGTIVEYAWDFGDGSTSTETDPIHTYTAVGTFQATLTVTDDDGATGTDTVAVSVAQVSQNELHIQSQTVSRQTFWRYARGVDEVLVTDQNNQPVAGAVVTAVYSGPNKGTVTGTTGSNGTVILRTGIRRNPRGIWCFEVTNVAKDGYLYNPAANVVTTQCEGQ